MIVYARRVLPRLWTLALLATGLAVTATAQKDVNVVNTPNVKVVNTPTVNVGNTPTVNVGNTANVNVTNTPTVQVSGTAAVQVQNDSSNPVIIRNNDEPARHFFQKHFSFVVQDGSFDAIVDLGTTPANAVLVIEYINMQVRLPGNQSVTAVVFQSGAFDSLGFAPVQTISNTGTNSTWIVDRPVKMYIPPNTPMQLFFGRTSTVGISQFGAVEISGYFVSTP
jgi:hypothetical protein